MSSNVAHGGPFVGNGNVASSEKTVRNNAVYYALSDGKRTWYLGNTHHWLDAYDESMLLTWDISELTVLTEMKLSLLRTISLLAVHIGKSFDMRAVCLNTVALDTNHILESTWIEQYMVNPNNLGFTSIHPRLPYHPTRGIYVVGEQRHVFDNCHVRPVSSAKEDWNIPTAKEFQKRHNLNMVFYKEVMNAVEALFEDPKMWDARQVSGDRYYWTLDFPGNVTEMLMCKVKQALSAKGWEVIWGCVNGNWDLSLYVNKDGK